MVTDGERPRGGRKAPRVSEGPFARTFLISDSGAYLTGPMLTIPDRLSAALSDRYHLERELGAGGMATVYLAEDLKHKRQVASSTVRPTSRWTSSPR